jgi:hypothetical protein
VPDAKPPHERLLELAVFGPLGVALAVRDHLPELAAEGRAELDRQVRAARMIGTFVVAQARREVEKRLASTSAATVASTDTEAPDAEGSDATEPVFPIDGYDGLTAADVLKRLAGLSAEDLRIVGDYERAHRNRRTVLGRIEQLGK